MSLISNAIKHGRNSIKLPSRNCVIRLTKTLKTFHYKGIICSDCGLFGTVFRAVEHSNKTHLKLFGSRDGTDMLMTCDHIIPYSQGGSNNFSNLQTLCCQCNYKKKDNVDKKLVESAQYSYKSVKDYIFSAYGKSKDRARFSREFSRVQTRARKFHGQVGLLCGDLDEILQLLYYIQEEYGYRIRLLNLRKIPSKTALKEFTCSLKSL
jgi:5-methylcytosine-specific restriction endonuclease McrA